MAACSATPSAPAAVRMAGKSERFFLNIVGILVATAAHVAVARADSVSGESRLLGIKFEALGGTHWCSPRIKIRLTAPSSNHFAPDTVAFLQMVGRIRAVVMSQCPQIENIAYEGAAGGQRVFVAEMSRLTRWRRLIELDPTTLKPICPKVEATECASQIEAYMTARKLFRGSAFAHTELTSTLEPDSKNLTLRSKGVIGKLRITPREQVAPTFTTAAQFASAIVSQIGQNCRSGGGTSHTAKPINFGDDLAQREVTCRPPNQPAAWNVILVWATNDTYRVFSLWAQSPAGSQALSFAKHLAEAIKNAR